MTDVSTGRGKRLTLVAKTPEEKDEWLLTLRAAICACKVRSSHVFYHSLFLCARACLLYLLMTHS
jgi:hypothetical protein